MFDVKPKWLREQEHEKNLWEVNVEKRWVSDISYDDARKLSFNALEDYEYNNQIVYEHAYYSVRESIEFASSKGMVSTTVSIQRMFYQENEYVIHACITWLIDRLYEEGYEVISYEDHIQIFWNYKYTFRKWLKTPNIVRVIKTLVVSAILFLWLLCIKNINYVAAVFHLPKWIEIVSIVDANFIAIIALIWFAFANRHLFEQIAIFKSAFGKNK